MLTIERAKQIIKEKYNRVGESILGTYDLNSTKEAAENVFYCFTEHTVLILKENVGCYYVLRDPDFFTTYLSEGLCSGIGVPEQDPVLNPDRRGKRQRFTEGHMYWHPNTRKPQFIRDGDFWDKYSQLRWEQGSLGYPTSAQRVIASEINNLKVERQSFQNGVIFVFENVKKKERFCFAFTKDGQAFPKRKYKLTLQKVKCIRESKGLGSDEVGMSIITTPSNGDSKIERWFHGDVDSGEEFQLNRVLYNGNLPTSLAVSLVGFEKDGPRAFKRSRSHFERTLVALDDDFDRDEYADDSIDFGVRVSIIGALVAGGKLALTASGSIIIIGGAAGAIIGAAIAAVLSGIFGVALAFRHPELLMVNRNVYLGDIIAGYMLGGMPPVDPTVHTEKGVTATITYSKEGSNKIIEKRLYENKSEKSRYELTLIHELQM